MCPSLHRKLCMDHCIYFSKNIVLLLSLFYKQQNSGIEGVLPRTNGKYCKCKTQPYTSAKKAEVKTAKHTDVTKDHLRYC